MLEGLFLGIAYLVGIFCLLWILDQIKVRLPDKSTKALSVPFGADRLSAHVPVEDFWLNEIRVGFVEEWETGHEFCLVGNGRIEFGEKNEDSENTGRLFLTFHPNSDAYPGTDQIGWCTVKDHDEHGLYVEARLLLNGETIANILNELRNSKSQTASIWGFKNEHGNVLITSFSLTPSD